MTYSTIERSPRLYARVGGALYLIIIVLGLFGEAFVRDRLLVRGDASATAANIRSMESLWRFHIAAELFLLVCAIVLLLLRRHRLPDVQIRLFSQSDWHPDADRRILLSDG